ncbi:MAG: TIGR03936 family radical SAM-associated protein [Lachnospiraceae bacterium]|nr:TIGR03936 family radical SAM-associated protein [Lachnospiraceae bacterium]
MKIIIKFSKVGSMKFIGHLDLMRYFQKCFRRANVPIAMSKGFSPHQILSFASPLGVGVTSEGDYLDAMLDTEDESYINKLKEDLNEVLNDEIRVVEIRRVADEVKSSMSLLCACDYVIGLKDVKVNEENKVLLNKDFIKAKLKCYLSQPEILVTKKTKKSTKEINIKDYIYTITESVSALSEYTGLSYDNILESTSDSKAVIALRVTAGSSINIKPELIMEDFVKFLNIEYSNLEYQIHRLNMYRDKNFKKGELHTLNTEIICDPVAIYEY